MKVYLDVLLIFNFFIDFLLLLSVAAILKRRVSFYRLATGAFIGSISVFMLFYPLSTFSLIMLKLLASILMILIAFSYNDLKTFLKNLAYLYFVSILLGGGLYLWNNTFSLNNNGLLFISNSYQLNFLGLIILSPILISYYVRRMRTLEHHHYYHMTDIYYKGIVIEGVGFIDSGNNLRCKKQPVVLVSKDKISFEIEEFILLPFQALNHVGVLKCFQIDRVFLQGRNWENIYLGVMENELGIDGVDFLLHREMMEVLL